jgi:hypothetical protein
MQHRFSTLIDFTPSNQKMTGCMNNVKKMRAVCDVVYIYIVLCVKSWPYSGGILLGFYTA